MTRFILALSLLAALICAAISQAGRPYVVSERFNGHIWRIEDVNGDGDALDVGERTLWGEGFSITQGMAADSRAVYVTEEGLGSSDQIVRLLDSNGDGDALDVGERTTWLDGLDKPRDISFDGDQTWYVSDFDIGKIWRLVDLDNDGDVLDIGEKTLFSDGLSGPQGILPRGDKLLVASGFGGPIRSLVDLNGDGDALDVAENLAITPDLDPTLGVLDDGHGGFYFTSVIADTVYHAQDNNGDSDMLDVAEVLSYADPVYGLLDGPAGLTTFDGGGFVLADSLHNQVKLVRDKNGDSDALDIGDVILFADGFEQPMDVVALPFGLPGDYNFDGIVDAADYVVWRKFDGTPAGYDEWRTSFGQTLIGGSSPTADAGGNIPESASAALFILGLAALGVGTRRAQSRWVSAIGKSHGP